MGKSDAEFIDSIDKALESVRRLWDEQAGYEGADFTTFYYQDFYPMMLHMYELGLKAGQAGIEELK